MADPVVCVVGAGTTALEGLLCARKVLGPSAELRLVAPDREFRYRPMSPDALFRPAEERGLPIADLIAETGAAWVRDRVDSVQESERRVVTREGDTVEFDYLLLATGSRSRRALAQGHVWARGGDPSFLDRIMLEIAAGEIRTVAVAIPSGARWPLPGYELALILAWTAAGRGVGVTLLTTEARPLEALGAAASDAVTGELDAAGVELRLGVEATDRTDLDPTAVDPSGVAQLRLGSDRSAEFDRLISLPTVIGPSIAGVRTDGAGFVEVDETLKVCGSERVWAAGGCIAAALEHSALAARQADAVIVTIAAVDQTPPASGPAAPELTGIVLTGQRESWAAENPFGTKQPSTRCLWWPPGRAVGGMLARRIAAWDPAVDDALPSHPAGLMIRTPVALGCSDSGSPHSVTEISEDVRASRVRDIENRQLMAVRRRERAAEAELRALSSRMETFTAHEHDVVRELQQHGYLQDRKPIGAGHRGAG